MSICIASAPVCWGIYEFEGIEPKYAYPRVLDELVETGYTGIELGPWGYLPTDAAVLRAELDKRGLQLLSAFVPVKLVEESAHEAGMAQAMQVGRLLAALGAHYVVLADDNGTVPALVKQAGRQPETRLAPAQWDVFAKGVNKIAHRLYNELGLKVVFHHHGAGYVETPAEVDALLQRTDPDLVGLCLDTGHWHLGGGDSIDAIRAYGERVRYLHLKDFAPDIHADCLARDDDYFQMVEAGIFCELGQGNVDFPAVMREMQALGYEGWAIVEQDVLSDDLSYPCQAAQRNRDYLRSLGY